MVPNNTFFKDCMRFDEKKIWDNVVFGPKIAISGLKTIFIVILPYASLFSNHDTVAAFINAC